MREIVNSFRSYWVIQKLPQIYTANPATFPIQIRKITVHICGYFWVTHQYIATPHWNSILLNGREKMNQGHQLEGLFLFKIAKIFIIYIIYDLLGVKIKSADIIQFVHALYNFTLYDW